MKRNNFLSVIFGLITLSALIFNSCQGKEPTLNVSVPGASFEANILTPTSYDAPANLELVCTSKDALSAFWTIPKVGSFKGKTVKVTIPHAGTYDVSMVAAGAGGLSDTIVKPVTITEENNFAVDPVTFAALTGGGAKTWIFDAQNTKIQEIKDATKLPISGHMGLGPLNSFGQSWWGAAANDKAAWSMYQWKIEFTSNFALNITTLGEGYGRKAFDGKPFSSTSINGDDITFNYNGGNYTYSLDPGNPYQTLTLSGDAFLGYYTGTQVYHIVYIKNDVMALATHDTAEGQDWVFVYIPKP